MGAFNCFLEFLGKLEPHTDLARQPINAAKADVQLQFFWFFYTFWPTIATKAQTGLLLDKRKEDHVGSLSTACQTAVIGPQNRVH